MTDPLRTDHLPEAGEVPERERDARVEDLLLAGLDHYFAGQHELAISVWTRVLFLDRGHARARAYIDGHYTQSDLSLNEVAAQVNLSPSHFSAVFSHETGETFKEYLTRLRIERAKELLRTTNLKSFEVAYQSGYNDPHYFSYIFRKNTGLSPQQFRLQPQLRKP